jgi:hypothetical protein
MQVDPIEPVIDTGAATPVAPSPGPSLNEPIDGSPPAVEAEAPTDRATPAVPEPPAEPASREPTPTPDAPPPGLAPRIVVEAPAAPEPLPAESVVESPPAGTNKDLPAEEGFTLRFESDAALARLVARNEVGLYAIGPRRSLRMSVNRGSYAFWSASAPNQYHEMDAGTVPVAVVAALRRSGSLGLAPDVKWGVTLPARMRRQLGEYLAGHASGALVIEGDGNLRLEP